MTTFRDDYKDDPLLKGDSLMMPSLQETSQKSASRYKHQSNLMSYNEPEIEMGKLYFEGLSDEEVITTGQMNSQRNQVASILDNYDAINLSSSSFLVKN
jgi:hypothetical protein